MKCYCFTCDRHFHYLGINRHRAMHRDRGEYCKIRYTAGNVREFFYNKGDRGSLYE